MKLVGILLVSMTLMFSALALGQNMNPLSGTEWQLVSLDGAEVVEGIAVTLAFGEDDRASGSAGCNSYGSNYTLEGENISFTMAMSTLMACADMDVMDQEQAYLSALNTASSHAIVDGQLVINYGEGEQLVFDPLLTLVGTSWQLEMLGENAVTSLMTLNLGEDDRAFGSGGCNNFSAVYTVDGHTLSFGPVLSTRAACPDTDTPEQDYFNALQAAMRYELAEDQLVIVHGEDEGEQMVFGPAETLANTQWSLVSYGGTDVIADTNITLEFSAGDAISGNTGCNTFRSTYNQDGDTLTINENIVTTRRACLSEDATSQEQAYLNALGTAATYALSADQLTITYGEGEELVFVRLSS